MDINNTTDLVNQKLEAHNLVGAIEAIIADADEVKGIARKAIADFDERAERLKLQADTALGKYELL